MGNRGEKWEDNITEAVLSFIIDRLGELIIQQSSSLVDVKDQVEDLQRELLWIQSFLQDADSRQYESFVARNWVSEIRDTAYDIEDIIDTYILQVADEDVLDHPPTKKRSILGYIKKYVGIFHKGANLYSLRKEIENVKSQIQQINKAMRNYGKIAMRNYGITDFGSQGGGTMKILFQQLRRSSPYYDAIDKDIVGLDKKVEKLVVELLREEDGCRCISITGMGGIGKTTLATKIYNCEEITRHFECRAWVNVSKEFNAKDIFKRLIKEVKPSLSRKELLDMKMFGDEFLQDKLRKLLKDRTYLVVLDDIWDVEAWISLNKAFPSSVNIKGRVILTSRNTKVARESVIHQVPTLNELDSWQLFVVNAFANDGCPKNLEELCKEMVKKCDGLPLAIIVLAGLLIGKSTQERFVRDRCHQLQMKGQSEILSLSYNDLPYQLKACYLYIGLFPENHTIKAEELIRLWVAEGFIKCERGKIMEDVAMEYWNELINRSMLKVVEQDDLGEVLSCRIHDLLRDICISKGQDENFIDYSSHAASSSSSTTSIVRKSRRYAIHSLGSGSFLDSNSRVRTILLFNPNADSYLQRLLESISNIRLLKVLDLSFVNFYRKRLPDAFGKLIHLRYIGLKNAKAKLPSSIQNLQSLQTLDLRWSDCHWSDKDDLSKLTQLRHLLLSEGYWDGLHREVDLPRIDTLTNLQTLWVVDGLVWKQNETTNLINLQKLRIRNIGALDVESVLSILSLQLSVVGSLENAFPMQGHHLQDLQLEGKIEMLPEFPPTSRLTKLFLCYSRLGSQAMAILEKLPNLILLTLSENSIMGEKIVCSAQGFPQLRVISIISLETEEWEIMEGALPKLNHLSISNCNNLRKIPMGLEFVATLQVLKFRHMPQEFRDRFDREDAHEIEHMRSIKTVWM